MEKHLTYPQAAETLGITVSQLKYYIEKNHIPYVKLGERKRLIKESELESYVRRNTKRIG